MYIRLALIVKVKYVHNVQALEYLPPTQIGFQWSYQNILLTVARILMLPHY